MKKTNIYLKYNQELYDNRGKRIHIGDTVVINSYFGAAPYIGKVSHFTESGNVAVFAHKNYTAYRRPETIIIIESNDNSEIKD